MKISRFLAGVALVIVSASHGVAGVEVKVVTFSEPGEPGYFYATLSEPMEISPEVRLVECRSDSGGVYLLAAEVGAGRDPAARGFYPAKKQLTGVYGRFSSTGQFKVNVEGYPWMEEGKVSDLTSFALNINPGGTVDEEVKRGWGARWAQKFRAAGYYFPTSFTNYFQEVAALRYGVPTNPSFGPRRRGDDPDLYSIFSSGAAIHESLQLGGLRDNPFARRQYPENERPVEIEKLAGPEVKSHPFAEMLGNRNPPESPLARFVPDDQYYVLFKSLDKQVEFSDLLRDSGGNLLNMTGGGGREYDVRRKLEEKLCLQQSPLSRLFGASVIGEVALTGEDPFFREGTGLTVIFSLKKPDLLRDFIVGKYGDATRSGAIKKSHKISGREVLSVVSPDGSISSFYAQEGDVAIISTSLRSLERSLKCGEGKIPSLAGALDLKYVRTIFKGDAAEEDLFIYLSDAHIRKLVGPKWKIGETRRLRCGANLELFSNAALWRKIEKNSFGMPSALAAEKYTGETPLCPDNGDYSIDSATGAPSCSVHGRLGAMTPVGDIPIAEATAEEARQYGEFTAMYSNFWRQYFDPIAIRVGIGKDIRVETLILPLIENSFYDDIVRIAGKGEGGFSGSPISRDTVVSLQTRIAENPFAAPGRREEFPQFSTISRWLGKEISLNVCDGQPFIGMGSSVTGNMMRGGGSIVERLAFGYIVAALNLPVYLSAEVTDVDSAKRALPELFTKLLPMNEHDRGMVETHRLDDYENTPVYATVIDFGFVNFRLFTSVVGSRLIVASRHEIIRNLIDGKTMEMGGTRDASMRLSVFRDNFKELAETTSRGYAEDVLLACKGNMLLAGLLVEQAGIEPQRAGEAIMEVKGYSPQCPSGGRYLPDGDGPGARCTVHGSLSQTRSSATLDQNAPVIKLINSIDRADFSLRFTEEGLRAVMEIKRN